VTDVSAAITSALTSIAAFYTTATVYFPRGTYLLGTSVTFPAGLVIEADGGALFSDGGTAGVVPTFNGQFIAPFGQVFNLTGAGSSVVFDTAVGDSTEGRVSWWGTDYVALQNAVDSGLFKLLVDQSMTLGATVSLPAGIWLDGLIQEYDNAQAGNRGPRLTFTGTGSCLDMANGGVSTTHNITMRNLRIDGTTNSNNNIIGLDLKDVRNCSFDQVHVVGFGAASTGGIGVRIDADFSWSTILRFKKCRVIACDTGVAFTQTGASLCNENQFDMCTFNSNGIGVDIQDGVSNQFIGCNFQGNTSIGAKVQDHDNTFAFCYLEAQPTGIEITTGGNGYNTALIGNYYINHGVADVANPDVLDIVRLDPGDNFWLPEFLQADINSVVYQRFYKSNDGTFPNCAGVYDSGATDWVWFYDKANSRVYSEVGWATRADVVEFTSDDTLTTIQSGSVSTNRGAAGTVTVSLPNAQIGLQYRFVRTENQVLRVNPAGASDLIRGGGVNKYLQLNAQGDSVRLTCTRNNVWEVESFNGTYTFEP
jgi:hypothetical protein